GSGEDNDNLFLNGKRCILSLFENFRKPLSTAKLSLRGFVEITSKLGEGCQLPELSQIETKRTRNLAHGFDLGFPTYARDRQAHVYGRANARVEKVAFEVDLAVGDRNDIGGDIGRHVPGLSLNDRQGSQRPPSSALIKLCRPLQQAGVKVENVSGISFPSRRS